MREDEEEEDEREEKVFPLGMMIDATKWPGKSGLRFSLLILFSVFYLPDSVQKAVLTFSSENFLIESLLPLLWAPPKPMTICVK